MTPVVIALGSNLGDRRTHLRRAIAEVGALVRLARLSSVWETAPVDAPAGSGPFLNMVVAGWTRLGAPALLDAMHRIERGMGRKRRVRNEPRTIDLDLILYGARIEDSRELRVPHPRYRDRSFVLAPLRELGLPWIDPGTGRRIASAPIAGDLRRLGSVFGSVR
ncbi:MAG TPA: 2-amino-4-hydroxy-6-hydroxymethyldihydropteridine diphosphokinase [Thermoanaerobaculia bacterium]|nr:2-amino-4-hydroxy-6-hydroxymethyldihydropteridine diphosphokinase [Thermoanaerobaculia bacterium]